MDSRCSVKSGVDSRVDPAVDATFEVAGDRGGVYARFGLRRSAPYASAGGSSKLAGVGNCVSSNIRSSAVVKHFLSKSHILCMELVSVYPTKQPRVERVSILLQGFFLRRSSGMYE